MKRKLIQLAFTLILGNCLPQIGLSQFAVVNPTSDAISISNFVETKAQWIKENITQSSMLQNTIELVKVYQDTKQLTGIVAAQVSDLNNLHHIFQTDLRNKDIFSQEILNDANKFLSWEDQLAGFNGGKSPYQPIFSFSDWYDSETALFRDNSGMINLASTVESAVSDDYLVRRQNSFYGNVLHLQQNQGIVNDYQVRWHLAMARKKERQVRLINVKLNMEVFKRSGYDILNKTMFLTTQDAWQNQNKTVQLDDNNSVETNMSFTEKYNNYIGSKSTNTATDPNSAFMTAVEVTNLINQMNLLSQEAMGHRRAANALLYKIHKDQMNPLYLDLMTIKRLHDSDNAARLAAADRGQYNVGPAQTTAVK